MLNSSVYEARINDNSLKQFVDHQNCYISLGLIIVVWNDLWTFYRGNSQQCCFFSLFFVFSAFRLKHHVCHLAAALTSCPNWKLYSPANMKSKSLPVSPSKNWRTALNELTLSTRLFVNTDTWLWVYTGFSPSSRSGGQNSPRMRKDCGTVDQRTGE